MIHAVGPIYSGPQDEALLASAYKASLARAGDVGATSVAFPAISTGVYGYPPEDAARVSVQAIRSTQTSVQQVFLVASSEETARLWEQALHTRGVLSYPLRGATRGSSGYCVRAQQYGPAHRGFGGSRSGD